MPSRRIIAALALAVIATSPTTARKPPYTPSTGQSGVYACADGHSVEVLYSGGDAVVITMGGRVVQMARDAAADGERYVGGGWQWWGRGTRDGMLSPLADGGAGASASGVACQVR